LTCGEATIIQRNHKQSGFTVLELALVFGIVGVLVSGIWSYMGIANQSSRVEQSVEAISLTVDSTRVAYVGKPAIVGGVATVMPQLVSMGAMPTHLLVGGLPTTCQGISSNYANTPWGGSDPCGTLRVCAWTVTPAIGAAASVNNKCTLPAGVLTSQYFAVEFTALNYQSCISLATRATPASPIPGLGDIYINGTSVFAVLGSLPVTPKQAVINCNANPALNTVDFIYSLRTPVS
jgi:type II secretory pathway pseudopilin PulG